MNLFSVACALLLSIAAGFLTIIASMPTPTEIAGDPAVIPVHGCHSDIRLHYVMEFRRSVRHYHKGPDCTPVLVED